MNLYTKDLKNLIQEKKFAEAKVLSQKIIATNPNHADPYFFRGVAEYQTANIKEAILYLSKALEIDPLHTDASICLSVIYSDLGQYDEAKKVFETANRSITHRRQNADLGIDQRFAMKHLELADLYFRYRRYDEALEQYTQSINLDPTQDDVRVRRARTLAKKGLISRAMDELQSLKKESPFKSAARIQIGLLHISQGNVLDAELEWESILQIDPNNEEAKNYLRLLKEGRIPKVY